MTTLKLYNGVSAFAGGRERNAVLDAFGWEIKVRPFCFERMFAYMDVVTSENSKHAPENEG